MKKRVDDFEEIIALLSKRTNVRDLPSGYKYYLDKRRKNLTLTLSEKGLKANMQDNESAFESWAIALRYYLKDIINTITIDWPEFSNENNVHFNRFVYRLSKFVQTYDWVSLANPIPLIPSTLVCNIPHKEAASAEEHQEGSEGWIENKYFERYCKDYDVMNHQLPVGIFFDKVSRPTLYTPGNKSAVDLWAIKDNELFIFELKKPGNNVLGIVSELMFYTNILHDIMSHRIQYQPNRQQEKAIKMNLRGVGDLYNSYKTGNIQKIHSVLLADTLHSLITPELLIFINESARLRFCKIDYSSQKVGI